MNKANTKTDPPKIRESPQQKGKSPTILGHRTGRSPEPKGSPTKQNQQIRSPDAEKTAETKAH